MRSKADGGRLRSIEFQLPTLVAVPPAGDSWIHEIKYDGYRTQLIVERGEARAFTRNGHDWSAKYLPIVEAARGLPAKAAIIDGEAIVMNEAGLPNFGKLCSAFPWQAGRIIFVAFDLLHLDGDDLRPRPTIERKAALEKLLGDTTDCAIQFSHHVEGGGKTFYKAAEKKGLEGMVSKRARAPYRSGRTESWLKIKCYEESDYEVAAVLRAPGRPLVAYMVTPDKARRYVGGAFITLNQEMRERLWARVQAKAAPLKGVKVKPGTEWLKPGLIGRVRHLKGEQLLRHATLQEIREKVRGR
jgi:DNA ligase D-like protein (predicted ligase)